MLVLDNDIACNSVCNNSLPYYGAMLFAFVRIGAHIFIMLTYVMQSRLFEAFIRRKDRVYMDDT